VGLKAASWVSRPSVGAVACGAVNGLGFDARQTWAFWRAEATPIAETPFRDASSERAGMIAVRTLPPRLSGTARLVRLALEAVSQLARALKELAPERVSFLVALPERYADGGGRAAERASIEGALGRWLAEQVGPQAGLHTVPRGPGGFAGAILEAGAALARGSVDCVIAGGADTYWDGEVVEALHAKERHFNGENHDRVIPGEGAGVARRTAGGRAPIGLRLLAAAVDEEAAPAHGAVPSRAEALGRALRSAAEGVRSQREARIDWLLGDVTNEGWRAHEMQLALPRALSPGGLDGGRGFRELIVPGARTDMLPARFGDLGAATLPTALAVAAGAFAFGDPVATRCLAFASSYGPDRGALLLAPGEGG